MVNYSGGTSKAHQAQEIAYDAMECMYRDEEKAASLCRKALSIYPDCVDALAMLAEIESETVKDYIESMDKAVKAGRKYLGKDYFEQECGNFWGLLETRPFMRAMAQLGHGYMQLGKKGYSQAIEVFEEMLELNPNDNQGIRDTCLAVTWLQSIMKKLATCSSGTKTKQWQISCGPECFTIISPADRRRLKRPSNRL